MITMRYVQPNHEEDMLIELYLKHQHSLSTNWIFKKKII